MSAATVFFLFAISTGAMPDFTALASYDSKQACQAAAQQVSTALASGQPGKTIICLSSEALDRLGKDIADAMN